MVYANFRRDTRKGYKLSKKKLGPICITKICGKNTYQLISLKIKLHADHLVKLNNTGDTVSINFKAKGWQV